MSAQTPLFDAHVKAGGKLVDFSGWQLPVHYGSLVEEHHAVRRAAGVFDVSHMTIVDITGAAATDYLGRLLANDPGSLIRPGAALYSCMLNEKGGVIDDLIVYRFAADDFRVIVNAATRVRDLQWMRDQAASFDVQLQERSDTAMVAVQGPQARHHCSALLPEHLIDRVNALARFEACRDGDWFVARTGYTGEDGYEIALPADAAVALWSNLLQAGVAPCGLGARDTLRLEAGMNLYGQDMDETQTPLTSGLAWTVAWQPEGRQFIGRDSLTAQQADGVPDKLVGFILAGKGVLRAGQVLYGGEQQVGEITSGTFSPTLQKSIAFGRVKATHSGDTEVQIRRNRLPVQRVSRVFARDGVALH